MSRSIAYLGPPGTYSEMAALAYGQWLGKTLQVEMPALCPYPSILQALRSAATGKADLAVVPVENSIEGGVSMTLDTLWQLETLKIHQALILPILHTFISQAASLEAVQKVYSHPQALGQCQQWLEKFLPEVQLVPTNSTTEGLEWLTTDSSLGVIASQRAAQLYHLPILASPINDYADNCTRFWVLSSRDLAIGSSPGAWQETATSLAFSLPKNQPGSLVKPLQIFADRQINLSRIESRPSKRSLGDYIFFVDLEAAMIDARSQSALTELGKHTEVLKILGSYPILQV